MCGMEGLLFFGSVTTVIGVTDLCIFGELMKRGLRRNHTVAASAIALSMAAGYLWYSQQALLFGAIACLMLIAPPLRFLFSWHPNSLLRNHTRVFLFIVSIPCLLLMLTVCCAMIGCCR